MNTHTCTCTYTQQIALYSTQYAQHNRQYSTDPLCCLHNGVMHTICEGRGRGEGEGEGEGEGGRGEGEGGRGEGEGGGGRSVLCSLCRDSS